MKKTILIDGDEFIYRATAALEHEIRWDEDNHVLYANEEQAWDNFGGMVGRICDRFEVGTADTVLCFSTAPNFRLQIDPTYKTHRKGARKPMCYAAIRERVTQHYNIMVSPGLEADDVMGILATQPSKKHRIIVSQDKDMRTIPATVWNGKDLLVISETEADYRHMLQTLTGDAADGYKGCPGIGAVKAEKLLDTSGLGERLQERAYVTAYMWDKVVAAYTKAGLTEADALVQARLARILRYSDWDKDKKEPILWTPN